MFESSKDREDEHIEEENDFFSSSWSSTVNG
jgi:hypothetical protein